MKDAAQPQEESIFLPKSGLDSSNVREILFSKAQFMQRISSGKAFILDTLACEPTAEVSTLTRDTRDFAIKLYHADPGIFSLLSCRGVVKILDTGKQSIISFVFILKIPEGLDDPRSLRNVLMAADHGLSLSARFKVAQQLATSISYVHTYGFVHKCVSPETVLVFQDKNSPLGSTYLVGFQKFRLAEGRTIRAGDDSWEKNIYRHPNRHGLSPEDDYVMQHDIYNLSEAIPSPMLQAAGAVEDIRTTNALKIKDALIDLARERLPSRMGDKYTDVVVNCLTCLDDDNIDFGDETEFQDADGVLVGVKYIEKILFRLDEIIL